MTIDHTAVNPIVTAISTPPDVLRATFSGLRPYTQYRVRLVAVNQAAKPGVSEWGQVMTLAAPPSEVGNLTAEPVSDGKSLLLAWGEPTLPNGKVRPLYCLKLYKTNLIVFPDDLIYG